MTAKIGFVNTHKHHINDNLYEQLKLKFPEYKVENIDLVNLIKQNKSLLTVNTFFTFAEYGFDILTRKRKFKHCFFRTKYIYNKIKLILKNKFINEDFVFTIQSNSLFDTSSNKVPHFIYTDHTHLNNLTYPMYDKNLLFPQKWIEREKLIYQNATKNFTYSSNIASSIVNDYNCLPEKVTCIFAGSNVKNRKIFNSEEKDYTKKKILFVGIDWERKGGQDLYNAFKKVQKIHSDAELIIIGSSPDIDHKNCKVLGKLNVEELSKFYNDATIFCLPTKIEPFGIVFLEAMLHKLPVVSTRIGALFDMVTDGETGYLVDPGDSDSLANILIDLLNNPKLCKKMGEMGYKKVIENYSWDKVGNRLREQIEPFIIK